MKTEPIKTFILTRPSIIRDKYELRLNDAQAAELQYPKWYSERAVASLPNGKKWEFIPRGIFKSRYDIREHGYENPFASIESHFFSQKAAIKLPKGKEVEVKSKFFKAEMDYFDANGKMLFTVKRKFSIREKTIVSVWEESPLFEEYPWLIILGCYMSVQDSKHSAAFVHT